ncbi:MAG: TIR domain-containing protein [Methylovirgula sp.]
MSRIFLSHSSKDNFEALALRDFLVGEGFDDVFLDLDPDRGIAAGERWERALHAAAKRCEAVIFFISGNWLASGWCLKEYSLARALNKKLFAVIIDPQKAIDDLPPELAGTWQAVNLTAGQDGRIFRVELPGSHEEKHVTFSIDGLRRLKHGLDKAGLDPKFFAWPPEDDPKRAPFRGLKPLEGVDAGIFFGRDAPIVEALDRLRGLREAAAPRFLAILGASGAGKSSFLRAGLLPRLTRDDVNFLPLPPIRPERAALTGETGLLGTLEKLFPHRARAELRAAILAGASGVRPLLAERAGAAFAQTLTDAQQGGRPPLIVFSVDQAEELFRSEGMEESMALLALLRDLAVEDTPAIAVLFAIRSDAYDGLENAKLLEGLPQSTLPLLPMPRGAYMEVIEGPARRYVSAGGTLAIEPRLTQALLEDLEQGGGSDALPLLAFTLEQLFLEYGATGALRYQDYRAFGGLRGAIDKAVTRAFARADADPRIPREQKSREALLRRGLIPWLAGIDPDSKNPRRNVARRSDIPDEARPLIDLLVEERLLSTDTKRIKDPVTGEDTQIVTIEPTHEALLRQWGLLEGWLAEDLGRLATLEGAKRGARDWDANGRADAWLAHHGQRLAEASALIDERPDIAARFDAVDKAYLAACRSKEAEEQAKEEARRREREEEQARRLADAEKLAAANKRTAQRTGIGLVAALALAGLAGWQGYVATQEKQAALQQQQRAEKDFNAAKQAINDLIFNVAERLTDMAGVPIVTIRQILGTAKTTIDTLAASEPDDKELQRSHWAMLVDFVDTYLRAGDLADAKTSADQALVIALELAKDLKNAQAQRDLSVSYNKVGDVFVAEGHLNDALKAYQSGLAAIAPIAKANPGNAGWQFDLGVSNERIGDVQMAQGNLAAALKSFETRRDIVAALVKSDPKTLAWQRDLSVANEKVGDVLVAQGHLDDALKAYQICLEIATRLADADANNAGWQRDLSVVDNKIGDVLVAQGHVDDALQAYQKALAIGARLAKSDPDNAGWQRDLAFSYNKIGDMLKLQGHLADALKSYQAGLVISQRLAKSDPGTTLWQRDVSFSYTRIGDVLAVQGQIDNALQSYQKGFAIIDRLAKLDPADAGLQRELSVFNNKLGDMYVAQGNLAQALQAYKSGLDIMQRLVKADPANAGWQFDLGISNERVGDVQMSQNQPAEALKSYSAKRDIIAGLVKADPGNAAWQRDLSVAIEKIGDALKTQSRLPEALQSYRTCLEIRQRLVKIDAGNSGWQRDLSIAYEKVGDVLSLQKNNADALQAYQASLQIRRLLAKDKSNGQAQIDLVIALAKAADLSADPRSNYQEVLTILTELDQQGRLTKVQQGWIEWVKKKLAPSQ